MKTTSWAGLTRILLKATVFFVLLNLLFAWLQPLPWLGQFSLYNHIWPGRPRLPYAEDIQHSHNLSLYNIPALFHSHQLVRPKADDEFRVLVMGDSSVWGWFLQNQDTLSARLNARGDVSSAGKRLIYYNLGYPVMSVTKDLMLLDEALRYAPDMVLWPVTLESLARSRQIAHPLLQHNRARVATPDERWPQPMLFERSIVGQRRELANLIRLQTVGLAWTATGVDQVIPDEIPLRQTDLEDDESWKDLKRPTQLDDELLALDVLAAGVKRAGKIPVVVVNEPMFVSWGQHSDRRYNSFYPRWAYDQYRTLLSAYAQQQGWDYLDLWEEIPAEEFSDTPVHLTPAGEQMLADVLGPVLLDRANGTVLR